MTDSFASIDGHDVKRVSLHVPARGPWVARVELYDYLPSGKVTLELGSTPLVGTVRSSLSDKYQNNKYHCTIVAGGGGWGRLLKAKAYQNDGGVQAREVAYDAAREAGETIDGFDPASAQVGKHYVRSALVPASRVLEHAIGESTDWWVDFDGLTQVGTRPAAPSWTADDYDVLSYDPVLRDVMVSTTTLEKLRIGSSIVDTLDTAQTVREFDVEVEKGTYKASCRVGDGDADLSDLLYAFVQRSTDRRIYGTYRYRVVNMKGDGRVEIQAVSKAPGLPDLTPVHMWPGLAGVFNKLTLSSEVLVQFIDGDPTQPVITHFAGKTGVAWEPQTIDIAVSGNPTLSSDSGGTKIDGGSDYVALQALVKAAFQSIQQTAVQAFQNVGAGMAAQGLLGAQTMAAWQVPDVAAKKTKAT